MIPKPIRTTRLFLRKAKETDSENLYRNYTSDAECSRFLTRKPHTKIEQTSDFLNTWCKNNWENDSIHFSWVVSLIESDEAIGVFLVSIDAHKAEIHFGLGKEYWRQGFATEAGIAVVKWLSEQKSLQRIGSVSDVLNQGSIKVLEKIGLSHEGILKNWLVLPAFGESARDCYIFGKTWKDN